MQLLTELLFADILRRGKDPNAPIARIFDIEARFSDINIDDLLFHFEARDFGPQGSQRVHDVFFQINKKLEPKRWQTGHELSKIRNNRPALMAFLVNGFIVHGHCSFYCSCESFLYGGFAYIATKENSNVETSADGSKAETRPPVKKNPNLAGMCCKHILGIVTNIKQFYDPMVTQLQQIARGQKSFKQFLDNEAEWSKISTDLNDLNVKEWLKDVEDVSDIEGENLTEDMDIVKKGTTLTNSQGDKLKGMTIQDVSGNFVSMKMPDFWAELPGNTYYLYFLDSDKNAQAMGQNKIGVLIFPPPHNFSISFSPISVIWTKRFYSEGTEHILGAMKYFIFEDEKKIYVDMISVRPGYKKNNIASLMVNQIKSKHSNYILKTSKRTKDGKIFFQKYDPSAEEDDKRG